ncbi:nuclear transport factor 2-like isoform X2 [Lytechinus variegatus]|uniref:nuclear transport factor 2-like isoform X2 n=1 Tax=Lytechinus variegatus TaxID=7654 RepID=UPI001BB21582|nr:nuclear transport factor 2-like isoform X2 [Lytechinus variegatus]
MRTPHPILHCTFIYNREASGVAEGSDNASTVQLEAGKGDIKDALAPPPENTPASVMCFEGSVCQGNEQIGKKLVSLPFQKVAHVVTVMDSLLIEESKLLISVIGQLKTDDDPPHGFAQTFILAPVGDNLMVFHDIFRLLVHNM